VSTPAPGTVSIPSSNAARGSTRCASRLEIAVAAAAGQPFTAFAERTPLHRVIDALNRCLGEVALVFIGDVEIRGRAAPTALWGLGAC
jgi:hypothetical protein